MQERDLNIIYIRAGQSSGNSQRVGALAIRQNGDETYSVTGSIASPLDRFVNAKAKAKVIGRLNAGSFPERVAEAQARITNDKKKAETKEERVKRLHLGTFTLEELQALDTQQLIEKLGLYTRHFRTNDVNFNEHGNNEKFKNVVEWFATRNETADA